MLFFVVVPWLLTHREIAHRDLLPGAALTAVGLVALMVVSRFVMQYWIDLYARDYGGLGVVLAIYSGSRSAPGSSSGLRALSPALAERREVPWQLLWSTLRISTSCGTGVSALRCDDGRALGLVDELVPDGPDAYAARPACADVSSGPSG